MRAALVLGSIACALVAAEIAARLARPDLGSRSFDDVSLGWSTQEYRRAELSPPPRDRGRTRLLVLGDSYLGSGYKRKGVDCRFPSLLDEREEAVEAEILASPGWGTDQQLLAYLQKGRSFEADVVLVAFCSTNDLRDVLSNSQGWRAMKPYFVLGEEGELALHGPTGRPLSLASLAGGEASEEPFQSYVLDWLRIRLADRVLAGPPEDFADVDPRYRLRADGGRTLATQRSWFEEGVHALDFSPQHGVTCLSAFLHGDHELNAYQWALLEAILRELDHRVRADGARLAIGLLPAPLVPGAVDTIAGGAFERRYETPDGPITVRAREPAERLHAIAERLGLLLWDPTAEFCEEMLARGLVERVWPSPDDRHFSCHGHDVLSGLLGRWLERELGVGLEGGYRDRHLASQR